MECKESSPLQSLSHTGVEIDTLWNVKSGRCFHRPDGSRVEIDTLWNVKFVDGKESEVAA